MSNRSDQKEGVNITAAVLMIISLGLSQQRIVGIKPREGSKGLVGFH